MVQKFNMDKISPPCPIVYISYVVGPKYDSKRLKSKEKQKHCFIYFQNCLPIHDHCYSSTFFSFFFFFVFFPPLLLFSFFNLSVFFVSFFFLGRISSGKNWHQYINFFAGTGFPLYSVSKFQCTIIGT